MNSAAMDTDRLVELDRVLLDLAHRQPIQLGEGEVDETLLAYFDELDGLTGQALADEIERQVFIGAMTTAVGVFLLRLFLLGSNSEDIPDEAQGRYEEKLSVNETAAANLADDIYDGRYSPNEETGVTAEIGKAMLLARLILWTASAANVYALGQLFNEANDRMRWQLGGALRHCKDCTRLNGQVHSKAAWLRAGIEPQSPDLLCGGWNCTCSLLPTTEPEKGGF